MESKLSSLVVSIRSLSRRKKITILSSLVLVLTLPTLVFVLAQQQNNSSKAESTTVIEAESGTLSGNVAIKTSDQASGGKYIQFVAPTQLPTPTPFQAPTPTIHPTNLLPTPTIKVIVPTSTPRPTPRPTVVPTPRPTSTPTPTPTPVHGNDNGNDK